eukprot:594937-Pyramimonas_sp.AAC.1
MDFGSPAARTRMAVVGLLDDARGFGISAYSAVLPCLKIGPLPIEEFFHWRDIPLFDGLSAPPVRRLKGTSDIHLTYYKAAGLSYPPDIRRYCQELQ